MIIYNYSTRLQGGINLVVKTNLERIPEEFLEELDNFNSVQITDGVFHVDLQNADPSFLSYLEGNETIEAVMDFIAEEIDFEIVRDVALIVSATNEKSVSAEVYYAIEDLVFNETSKDCHFKFVMKDFYDKNGHFDDRLPQNLKAILVASDFEELNEVTFAFKNDLTVKEIQQILNNIVGATFIFRQDIFQI